MLFYFFFADENESFALILFSILWIGCVSCASSLKKLISLALHSCISEFAQTEFRFSLFSEVRQIPGPIHSGVWI